MTRRGPRWAHWCAALALLAACGDTSLLGPDAAQGIDGLVLVGPQCPVQQDDVPCPDLALEATVEIWTGGEFVTRVRSGIDGRFRVGLLPGSYELRPRSGNPFPSASPLDVEVEADVWAVVTIRYDSGIR